MVARSSYIVAKRRRMEGKSIRRHKRRQFAEADIDVVKKMKRKQTVNEHWCERWLMLN